jgi:hypothetical protein
MNTEYSQKLTKEDLWNLSVACREAISALRHAAAEQRQTVYLAAFYQIAKGSLNPRQFGALEAGARALLREAERMEVDIKGDNDG